MPSPLPARGRPVEVAKIRPPHVLAERDRPEVRAAIDAPPAGSSARIRVRKPAAAMPSRSR